MPLSSFHHCVYTPEWCIGARSLYCMNGGAGLFAFCLGVALHVVYGSMCPINQAAPAGVVLHIIGQMISSLQFPKQVQSKISYATQGQNGKNMHLLKNYTKYIMKHGLYIAMSL